MAVAVGASGPEAGGGAGTAGGRASVDGKSASMCVRAADALSSTRT